MDIEGLEVSYKGVLDTSKDVTGDKINAEGIPITYENKDILSEEDFQ